MRDIRQSSSYANYLAKIGWRVERIDKTFVYIKKIPLLGSVIKIQRPEKIRYEEIGILNKKYKAFQVIIEPKEITNDQWLRANGFKLSKSPYLPTKTLHLDLTPSIHRCMSSMKKDARYALRKIQKSKMESQNCQNLVEFRNSWKAAVGWKRRIPSIKELTALKESFKDNSLFLLAYSNDSNHSTFAGAIFLVADKVGYYWQAFTGEEGRKSLAQYRIVWEGIKWAKKKGAKIFDFEGIYDEKFPIASWKGFAHFKKSFGGKEVSFPGTYIKTRFWPLTD